MRGTWEESTDSLPDNSAPLSFALSPKLPTRRHPERSRLSGEARDLGRRKAEGKHKGCHPEGRAVRGPKSFSIAVHRCRLQTNAKSLSWNCACKRWRLNTLRDEETPRKRKFFEYFEGSDQKRTLTLLCHAFICQTHPCDSVHTCCNEMGRRHKQSGGNSHQRSIDRATGDHNPPPQISKENPKKRSIPEIAFSWPAVTFLAGSFIGIGFNGLSMSPPETKIAAHLFSIGFPLLLIKLCTFAAFEIPGTRLQKIAIIATACVATGGAWYKSVAFADSKIPRNGPEVLAFDSLIASLGNMPERKSASNTWDGKPWNDDVYTDVRLTIENKSNYRVENVDLTVATPGEDSDPNRILIGAIDQVTHLPGVEFPKPPPVDMNLRLRGKDNEVYNFPVGSDTILPTGWGALPRPAVKVFMSKLVEQQKAKLIIGTLSAGAPRKVAPRHLKISGTYDVVESERRERTTISRVIDVK